MRPTTSVRLRRVLTLGATATAAALGLSSCGESDATGTGGDGVAPRITISAAGVRRDTVDVNSRLAISFTATDNFALRWAVVRVATEAGVIFTDSTGFTGAAPTFTKALSVPTLNIGRGRRITVRAQAQDAGGTRSTVDSLLLTTVDTLGPVVAVNGPVAGRVFVRGDTIPIDISTTDSSGVAFNGYVLQRVNGPGDTVLVQRDSIAPVAPTAAQRNLFRWVVPQGAIAGTYVVRGFGRDISTLTANSPTLVEVTVRDQTPPTISLLAPAADTLVSASDTSVVVRVQAGDNSGLVRVRVFGYTLRGDPAFGRVDTLIRYSDNLAPAAGSFRANLLDTTVQRRLRPTGHTAAAETVFVAVEATDESGNRSVATRRVFLIPNRFTQDQAPPALTILEPAELATLPLGVPVRVRALATDNFALKQVRIFGLNIRGDPALGRRDTTVWLDTAYAPSRTSTGADVFFPAPFGTDTTKRDTVIVRDLTQAVNVTEDTLTLVFRITDWADRTTEISRRTVLRRGPSAVLLTPASGLTTFRGDRIEVRVRANSSPVSNSPLRRIGFRITGTLGGAVTWSPAPVDSIIATTGQTTATLVRTVQVPVDVNEVPNGAVITITPYAADELSPTLTPTGATATLTVNVPPVDVQPPVVYNARVDPRVERNATFSVRGRDAGGITRLGYVLRDELSNAVYLADSASITGTVPDTTVSFSATIADSLRGRRFKVTGFAIDAAGNRGGTVPVTSNVPSAAAIDTARGLFTFGSTFINPAIDSLNLAADLVVDRRGNAYLSNINRNRLEYWQRSGLSGAFSASPIVVGAQPWGMAFNLTGDTLFVANSGGTNISRVDTATRQDSPGNRIRTPNTLLVTVQQTIDEANGLTRYSDLTAVQFADRPQFVAFSANNSIYYSTRPTVVDRPGTVRRLLRNAVRNEVQFLTTYAQTDVNSPWVISNADSVVVLTSSVSTVSDVIGIFDRPLFGADAAQLTDTRFIMQNTAGDQVIAFNATRAQWIAAGYTTQISATTVPGRWGSNIASIVLGMQASGSDVTARPFRTADLQLTDTTFVAAGGNGNFVAFGEGNTGAGSRVITIREPAGASGPIGAAALSVADLSGNAADRIFGLTVDSLSQGVLANGTQAFFAALDTLSLFNLRLEGSYRTTLPGAGVAFHPQYVGPTSALDRRVAFVAQGDTSIAIVDAYNYVLRRVLPLRARLYGPIRAVRPQPDETTADPELRVKLYALTREGLVVIPIRAADLQ
ncbi:MAG: hypothetical protein ACK53A_05420 [Gemmatimonadota bacterium]|jgi:hypothetical protein|nr:hypothetical protein [Gemmatimonadota bacterium]